MFDRDRRVRTSIALWIPVVWMLLATSASKWLQITPGPSVDVNLEGNPIERNIFTGLLAIGIAVLISRGRKTSRLLRMNGPILLLVAYWAVSTLWSDYPDVAFKRWIKALGDFVMVMIILTDPEPTAAIKRFLARAGFILIPTSVLLVKYYPNLGMAYKHGWEDHVATGVTNDKNMLGVICLLFGVAAVWRILHALQGGRLRVNRPLIAQGAILGMVFWLFAKAHSMTSFSCFGLASCLILATTFRTFARKRAGVHLLVAIMVVVASLFLFFDAGSGLLKTLGKDPTLTGRTDLWNEILPMAGNPFFGAGFESFWMGSRLDKIWAKHWWHPNEAHNGYIEVFLNLGWIGLLLLGIVIVTGYRGVVDMLRLDPEAGRLKVAYFVIGVIYSFTEAGFRLLNPVWICFVLAAIAVPKNPIKETSQPPYSLEPLVPEYGVA
jgi:exopolysaccharide production protein ExoQ